MHRKDQKGQKTPTLSLSETDKQACPQPPGLRSRSKCPGARGEHGEAAACPSLSPQPSVVPSTSPVNAAAWASMASPESPVKMPITWEGTHGKPSAQVGLQSCLDNTKEGPENLEQVGWGREGMGDQWDQCHMRMEVGFGEGHEGCVS